MNPLERAVLAVAALLSVLGVVGWVTSSSPDTAPVSPLVARAVEMGYMPCEDEGDGGPCYWDASRSGNGVGSDFVVTADQEVFYADPSVSDWTHFDGDNTGYETFGDGSDLP